MDFMNRYSRLIEVIEDAVDQNEQEKMYAMIQKEMGMNIRGIASAFYYITGKELLQYTKERRTVHAAESYLKDPACTLEVAAERYHYSDFSALSKAIKKLFGKSPKDLSDEDLRRFPSFSIDQLLSNQGEKIVTISEKNDLQTRLVMGMESEEYEKQNIIHSIIEVSGHGKDFAEYAYELSMENNISIPKVCHFLSGLYGLIYSKVGSLTYYEKYSGKTHKEQALEVFGKEYINQLLYINAHFKPDVKEADDFKKQITEKGISDIRLVDEEFHEDIYVLDYYKVDWDLEMIHKIRDFLEKKQLESYLIYEVALIMKREGIGFDEEVIFKEIERFLETDSEEEYEDPLEEEDDALFDIKFESYDEDRVVSKPFDYAYKQEYSIGEDEESFDLYDFGSSAADDDDEDEDEESFDLYDFVPAAADDEDEDEESFDLYDFVPSSSYDDDELPF